MHSAVIGKPLRTASPLVLNVRERNLHVWEAFSSAHPSPLCRLMLVATDERVEVHLESAQRKTTHPLEHDRYLREVLRDALAEHFGPVVVEFGRASM